MTLRSPERILAQTRGDHAMFLGLRQSPAGILHIDFCLGRLPWKGLHCRCATQAVDGLAQRFTTGNIEGNADLALTRWWPSTESRVCRSPSSRTGGCGGSGAGWKAR